jgi:protein gp37
MALGFSVEPQLDKIDLMAKVGLTEKVLLDLVDWVISGGESGHSKRPFDCDWARLEMIAKVKGPILFKQIDRLKQFQMT